ncbi:MAG: DUF1175 family protein [Candidatus Hydrothermales bacterium]
MMTFIFFLTVGVLSDREILRKKFVENLIDIFLKKDTNIVDCAHFIRMALIKALSDFKGIKLNINKKNPFLVKEKGDFIYSSFADVKNLILYNTIFLGKNKERINLESGDILFYYNPKQEFPYHSIVYLRIENDEYLIYHTGPSERKKGEFKLIKYNLIFKHPDPIWYPIPSNENFLGFFRLKYFED